MDCVRPVVAAPEVAAAWDQPSALEDLTVGALTAHLVYAAGAVDSHLDRSWPEDADPIDIVAYYLGTLHGEETSTAARKATASRDAERAEPGPDAVLAHFDQVRDRLGSRLPTEDPERMMRVPIGRCMRLDQFLVTRVLEVMVHADDLAVSVSKPSPSFSPECGDAITALLLEICRQRHGDMAVIRAFARRERDVVDALRVF
jgi:hypothetical protein